VKQYLINKGMPEERIISDEEFEKETFWFCSSCHFVGKPSDFPDPFGYSDDSACPKCENVLEGHYLLTFQNIEYVGEFQSPYKKVEV